MEADGTLLKRYATTRDADAFAELVRRYAGMVYNVARRATGSASDADDVTQICFLELGRRAGAIHGSLAAWLHDTVVHRAADTVRNRLTRARHERAAGEQPAATGVEWDWAEVDGIVAHVDAALAELPDDLRVPLVEHYLQGRSQAEVAAAMGVNQSTVSRRLRDGVERVRERLVARGVTAAPAVAMPAALSHGMAEGTPAGVVATLNKVALAGVGPAPLDERVGASVGIVAKPVVVAATALCLLAVVATTVWRPDRSQLSPIPTSAGATMPTTIPAGRLAYVNTMPVLPVTDLRATVAYYTDVLGFDDPWFWGDPPTDAGVRSGGRNAFMFEHAPARATAHRGTVYVVNVREIDALRARHQAAGATIVSDVEDKPWGVREYTVEDVNGYRLRFSQDADEAR